MEESTGGRGGVVVIGAVFLRLSNSCLWMQDFPKKNIVGSEMLEKHIFQVPVARGENSVGKFFLKDLGNKKVCHNPWPLF